MNKAKFCLKEILPDYFAFFASKAVIDERQESGKYISFMEETFRVLETYEIII